MVEGWTPRGAWCFLSWLCHRASDVRQQKNDRSPVMSQSRINTPGDSWVCLVVYGFFFLSKMPLLFLGFALGAVATKTLRTVVGGPPSVRAGRLIPWVDEPVERTARQKRSPLKKICRFANYYNNCWMNSTLQATLNLNVVRKKLPNRTLQFVKLLANMPAFACLYLSALENPGVSFTAAELCVALAELCDCVPALLLYENNDSVDLLVPLLSWFDQCGIRTSIKVRNVSWCPHCHHTTSSISNLGNIVTLPRPRNGETLLSLMKRATSGRRSRCKACGHKTMQKQFWPHSDILTFFVNRIVGDGYVCHDHVYSPELLEMNVNEKTKQTYRLASVICHDGVDRHSGHFWSYLFSDNVIIEANDTDLSFTDQGPPDKVYNNGTTYLYEMP
ncbi:uncharacterized protein LOC133163285 [Syngnathus typhle]|uniref:uncharacterized protein LOC133163285 n=1 Tax=Syngnathus typhle TaxID=161592 RepID=UPI002A6B677F|nr:uncharacterized protein LOC133163285 [Syngnathus typhle]